MQIKRCSNCKAILEGDIHRHARIRCEKCNEIHSWMFWIDITGTAAAKEYMELNNLEPKSQVDATYIDGQIKQAELYALLWIAEINSGSYKLRKDQRGYELTDLEKAAGKEQWKDGWRDMTDEEKFRHAHQIAATHIQRIEELSEHKAKMLKGEV